jgi:hypothetical protein
MPESRSHKQTGQRIAKKIGAEYNSGKGVDVKKKGIAVEVETEQTVGDAGKQLRGHRGKAYVAPTTQKGVEKAKERYKGTTIGVMDKNGKVVKRSTRK